MLEPATTRGGGEAADRHGRLHWFLPEELNEEQRRYYERLVSGPRNKSTLLDSLGRLEGAFNSRLLDPPVGTAVQELGAALRFRAKIPGRLREIAILEVARAERSGFEWNGHAAVARAVGMTEQELDAIRLGQSCPSFGEDDEIVRRIVKELITRRDLSGELYAEAESTLGLIVLFDVISLVGHYQHTALSLRVWRVPMRAGEQPPRWEE